MKNKNTRKKLDRKIAQNQEKILEELQRLREIQECGGIDAYHRYTANHAMNSTCLGASVDFG